MNALFDDLRHAWRGLRNHPGTSLFATITLACGLAATLAILCVIDAVLWRDLPYPNAERIVQLREQAENGREMALAMPNYRDLIQGSESFAASGHYNWSTSTIGSNGRVLRQPTTSAGGDFFRVFGVAPLKGRTFGADEREPVAVISHALWQGLLGGRDDVIGLPIEIGGELRSIVGVMPEDFTYPARSAAWTPDTEDYPGTSRTAHNHEAVALLRTRTALDEARMGARVLADHLLRQYGKDIDAHGFAITPLADALAAPVRNALTLLAAGTAFLLLIAVTNAINLVLALNAARRREFAVRSALGATSFRLARQTAFEALAISLVATVLGLCTAALALRLLARFAGDVLPRVDELALSPNVVALSFAGALAIALLLTAATRLAGEERHQPVTALRDSGRSQTSSRGALRTRGILLVAQTAFTTVLLVAAGLLGRSFMQLMSVDPGFRSDGAVSVQLTQPWTRDPTALRQTSERYQRLIEQLRSVPGVSAAGGVNDLPLAGGGADGAFWEGSVTDLGRAEPIGHAEFRVASDGYWQTMGIPLLRGRVFDDRDRADGEPVAVISASVARATWGERDPIGQRIQMGNMDGDMRPLTIVGVVGDVHERHLERSPTGTVYVHLAQRPAAAFNFDIVVSSDLPLASLMPSLRQVLDPTSSELPYALRPLSELRQQATSQQRFNLVLLGSFAAIALLLAVGGLYGLMSFAVGQRRREFALRQALGAPTTGILRLVVSGGLRIALIGIAAGWIGALALSRLTGSLLHGIPATDAPTLLGVSVLLLTTLLLASWLPARRACAVPPAEALA